MIGDDFLEQKGVSDGRNDMTDTTTKNGLQEYGGAIGWADPLAGYPSDYPCRTCGDDPGDFASGPERCDDRPCEELKTWQYTRATKCGRDEMRPTQIRRKMK